MGFGVVKHTPEDMRQFVQQGLSAVADLRSTAQQRIVIGETMATATLQGAAGTAVHQGFVQNVQQLKTVADTTEEKCQGTLRMIDAAEEATMAGAARIAAIVPA